MGLPATLFTGREGVT